MKGFFKKIEKSVKSDPIKEIKNVQYQMDEADDVDQ